MAKVKVWLLFPLLAAAVGGAYAQASSGGATYRCVDANGRSTYTMICEDTVDMFIYTHGPRGPPFGTTASTYLFTSATSNTVWDPMFVLEEPAVWVYDDSCVEVLRMGVKAANMVEEVFLRASGVCC